VIYISKINNDKYYTDKDLALYCINKTYKIIGEENISEVIEPSAGNGSFSLQIPSVCWAYDIEPEHESIKKQNFLDLKYEELSLAYEYQLKKQEEKEELRILREQQREDAKVAREIEEKRREIEKEQQHYENALNRLNDQIEVEKSETRLQFLLEKKKEIEDNLVELDIAMKEVDYREANQRAGYVYIISNIGAFGENVFKIGMTRRLDPQERVDELGNASVPFRYDIHAMIFSDDAPKLENALHRAFEQKRINAINNRKEFFRVTLAEIEEVVKENHDNTVEFTNVPPAQQYRETLKIHISKNG
jgi:hypothetical protein